MALTGIKYDSDTDQLFVSNCLPVRSLVKRQLVEGDGAWLVAYRTEQRRRFKAILCGKPHTYSRIREERKKAEEQGIKLRDQDFKDFDRDEEQVLDGFFLLKHCCVEDPSDLCSVNISGLGLTEAKEDDFHMFDSVISINAGENYLPFGGFRGFPVLRELEVPLNGLRDLKIQHNEFSTLEVLDLSYNNLAQRDILSLGLLPNLRLLRLTGNNFHNLPEGMAEPYISDDKKVRRQRFSRLEVLLLDDNKLADEKVFSALAALPQLRHLNLEKNQIVRIPHLICVEGHIAIHHLSGSYTKNCRGSSGRKSARRKGSNHQAHVPKKLLMDQNADHEGGNKRGTEETEGQRNLVITAIQKGKQEKEGTSAKEQSYQDLLADDFSLGELSNRIHELEKEEAGEKEKKADEEKEPKTFPPFPELWSLNLAGNKIQEESAVLAVATWPALVNLAIHSNPLTTQRSGDPPLLKRFLSDRLGINLQRKVPPRLEKPHIEIQQNKTRKVSDKVPKVPHSTIEERLALEAPTPKPTALHSEPFWSWPSGKQDFSDLGDKSPKRWPPLLQPTPPPHAQANQSANQCGELNRQGQTGAESNKAEDENYSQEQQTAGAVHSDTFFMTQLGDEEVAERKQVPTDTEIKKAMGGGSKRAKNKMADRYQGYEALLELDAGCDVDMELPKDIQGNVRALKYTLEHPLVYRDPEVDLDRVKPRVPEFRRAPVPPAQPHKSYQQRVDDLLENLRTQETVEEEKLADVLRNPHRFHKKFPDASHLLGQIQQRYNAVRVSSIKPTQEARNVIDEAFKVLNKPKQKS